MPESHKSALPVEVLLQDLGKGRIHRVSGTAVYMSGKGTQVPTALLHNLKHNQVLHERVILLHVITLDQPRADSDEMLDHQDLGEGLYRVVLKFGFAETPDVPAALRSRLPENIRFQPGKATYFLGRETYWSRQKGDSSGSSPLVALRDHGAQRLACHRLLPTAAGPRRRTGCADHALGACLHILALPGGACLIRRGHRSASFHHRSRRALRARCGCFIASCRGDAENTCHSAASGELLGNDSPHAARPGAWIEDRSMLTHRKWSPVTMAALHVARQAVADAGWSCGSISATRHWSSAPAVAMPPAGSGRGPAGVPSS